MKTTGLLLMGAGASLLLFGQDLGLLLLGVGAIVYGFKK